VRAVNRDRGTELARRVEKADTFWARLRGLRGRAVLPQVEALWIIPCRGVHTRGMAFPIDVVFLDGTMKVVAVEENLPPGRLTALRWKARTVLELPPGTVRRTATGAGDQIDINHGEEM